MAGFLIFMERDVSRLKSANAMPAAKGRRETVAFTLIAVSDPMGAGGCSCDHWRSKKGPGSNSLWGVIYRFLSKMVCSVAICLAVAAGA